MNQRGRTVEFRTVDPAYADLRTPRSRSLGPRTSAAHNSQFRTSPSKNATNTPKTNRIWGSTVSPDRGVKLRTSPARGADFNASPSRLVEFVDSPAQQDLLRRPQYNRKEPYFIAPRGRHELQEEFRSPLHKTAETRRPRNHSVESRSSSSGAVDYGTSFNQRLEYDAPLYNHTGRRTLSGQSENMSNSPGRLFVKSTSPPGNLQFESQAARHERTSIETDNTPVRVLLSRASFNLKEEYNAPTGVDQERIPSYSRNKEYLTSPSRNDKGMTPSEKSTHHISRHAANVEYTTPYGKKKEFASSPRRNEEYLAERTEISKVQPGRDNDFLFSSGGMSYKTKPSPNAEFKYLPERPSEFMNSLEKSKITTTPRSSEDYFTQLQRNEEYIPPQRRNEEHMTSLRRNDTYMLPPTRDKENLTSQWRNEGYTIISGRSEEYMTSSNGHAEYVTPLEWRVERLSPPNNSSGSITLPGGSGQYSTTKRCRSCRARDESVEK